MVRFTVFDPDARTNRHAPCSFIPAGLTPRAGLRQLRGLRSQGGMVVGKAHRLPGRPDSQRALHPLLQVEVVVFPPRRPCRGTAVFPLPLQDNEDGIAFELRWM